VTLPDDLYEDLRSLGSEVESSLAGQLRRGARLLLRGGEPSGEPGFDPAEWHVTGLKNVDTWLVKTGRVSILTARSKLESQGAHIVLEGSEALFVLPDSATTGLKRSLTISEALADIEVDSPINHGVKVLPYVAGKLLADGASALRFVDAGQVNYGDA
jgi:hypothetical protein